MGAEQQPGEPENFLEPGGPAREETLYNRVNFDPYLVAEAVYNIRVEALQVAGLLRRSAEIGNEWEQDDHFDDLARIYRETCLELGLPWPPVTGA